MLHYHYRTTLLVVLIFLLFACKKFDISKYAFSYVGYLLPLIHLSQFSTNYNYWANLISERISDLIRTKNLRKS